MIPATEHPPILLITKEASVPPLKLCNDHTGRLHRSLHLWVLTKDCLLLLDLKRLLLAYKTQPRVLSENPTQFPAYPGLLLNDQELMGLQPFQSLC